MGDITIAEKIEEEVIEEANEEVAEEVKREQIVEDSKENSKNNERAEKESVEEFYASLKALAELMNESVETIKNECCAYQMKKLMSKLGKVLVRYDIPDKELERVMKNSKELNVGETLVAPAYIPACARQVKKLGLENLYVGAIIDFPFGESLLRSKITGCKDAKKEGVDGLCVMMPTCALKEDKIKGFKREINKFSRVIKGEVGIAMACQDLAEKEIKVLLKSVEKSKIKYLNLTFGEITLNELKDKMSLVNKYRGKKEIRVIANVENAQAVSELFKAGADFIYTPYVDEIGKTIVEKLKIKNVKVI